MNSANDQPIQATSVHVPMPAATEAPTESKSSCFTCCGQGGCCSNQPERVECDSNGKAIRVNVPVYGTCCESGIHLSGLDHDDLARLPLELKDVAPSMDFDRDWIPFIQSLADINSMSGKSCSCAKFTNILFVMLFAVLIFPIVMYCKAEKKKVLERDAKLRIWQAEVNKKWAGRGYEGIFLKTRSKMYITYNHKGERQRHTTHWLAIALTEGEAEVLKNEPHLSGIIDTHTCCDQVDESTLCWHK